MNNQEERLKTSVFFIEATSFEKHYLWKEFEKETGWEQDLMGFGQMIGHIGKNKPVFVSFSFAKIHGKIICFYEVTSRYADHTMVEEWIEKNYPVKWDNNTRRAMTDAMNFHLAIDCCKNEQ